MSGIHTPQYKKVLDRYSDITGAIRNIHGSKEVLEEKFVAKRWIGLGTNPTAKNLVNIALGRIEVDATEYDVFYNILSQITGMEPILRKLDSPDYSSTFTAGQSTKGTIPTLLAVSTRCPSMEEVEVKIHEFEQRFSALKKSTQECLESLRVSVKEVMVCLTDLPINEKADHESFLQIENIRELKQAQSHSDLFIHMNSGSYWSYLAYYLLEHLIKKLPVEEVKKKMDEYKSDLHQFMLDTPLEMFRRAQKERVMEIPAKFKELVVNFAWPENVTLAVVERFRQQYAYHYNLHDCAMMLITICRGSFIVVWCIPESIVKYLMKEVAEDILSEYQVTRLEIAGVCVYKQVWPLMIHHRHLLLSKPCNSASPSPDTSHTDIPDTLQKFSSSSEDKTITNGDDSLFPVSFQQSSEQNDHLKLVSSSILPTQQTSTEMSDSQIINELSKTVLDLTQVVDVWVKKEDDMVAEKEQQIGEGQSYTEQLENSLQDTEAKIDHLQQEVRRAECELEKQQQLLCEAEKDLKREKNTCYLQVLQYQRTVERLQQKLNKAKSEKETRNMAKEMLENNLAQKQEEIEELKKMAKRKRIWAVFSFVVACSLVLIFEPIPLVCIITLVGIIIPSACLSL